jgi:thiol-disulfide isomerase/thioredoxin
MRKHFLAATVVAVAFGSIATSTARAQDAGITLGADAPAAAVEMLDGAKVDLTKYYGDKPVVLEFWATWCPLCKKLEPKFQAVRAKYAGRVTFVGVGVSANQTPERQRDYVAKEMLSGEYVFDRDDAATKAFAAPHTSYVVVIDKHKKVVYTGVGPEQDIEAAVKKALP